MDDARDAMVVIAGAGAAGLAAAISCARSQRAVVVVDPRVQLGGTVTHARIHTIAGCFDAQGEVIAGALCGELIARLSEASPLVVRRRIGRSWTLSTPPGLYATVLTRWLAEESRITLELGHRITAVEHAQGRVLSLRSRDGTGHERRLAVQSAIDCSGDASLTRLVDPTLVEDASTPAAGGVILVFAGIDPQQVRFPQSLGVTRALRAAVSAGSLPSPCERAWCDLGPEPGQAYIKIALLGQGPLAQRQAYQAALRTVAPLQGFLRSLPGCSEARCEATGCQGIRDGGGIVGEYRLSAADVRSGRSWGTGAGRCSWPIEYWDASGGLTLEHLPPGVAYEIPLPALQVRGMANLLAAGRCLSAEPLARASARVVGSCWTMGELAGRTAAAWMPAPAAAFAGEPARDPVAHPC